MHEKMVYMASSQITTREKGNLVDIEKFIEASLSYFPTETKNQWARDDPAFVVICSLLLAVSTVAYCAA